MLKLKSIFVVTVFTSERAGRRERGEAKTLANVCALVLTDEVLDTLISIVADARFT